MNIILKDPATIYHSVTGYFPLAKMTHIYDSVNQSLSISIKLSNEIEPICLQNAVKEKDFLSMLQGLLAAQILRKENAQSLLKHYKFSIEEPLSPLPQWQKFQRILYEKNGNSCEKLIRKFLIHEQQIQGDIDLIHQLGLDPGQISTESFPDVSFYFRRLLDSDKEVLAVLSQKYPDFLKKIREEKIREDIKKYQDQDPYRKIISELMESVLGQDQAIRAIALSLSASSKNPKNYSFLFVGPTGVGKTELATALAFTGKKHLITFKMQQYTEEHRISDFLGSPLGYTGSGDKPAFAKMLDGASGVTEQRCDDKTFYSKVKDVVLLFDELEKAHPKIRQALLSIFETTGKGAGEIDIQYTNNGTNKKIRYHLMNSIIIGTSNLYQQLIVKAFEDKKSSVEIIKHFKEENRKNSIQGYSPEFLSRVSVVPFGPIPKGSIYQKLLSKKMTCFLSQLKEEWDFKETVILNPKLFFEFLEMELYGNGTDLRGIEKYFEFVSGKIHEYKSSWGSSSNIKIILYAESNTLMLRVESFVYGDYINIPGSMPIKLNRNSNEIEERVL